MREREVKLAAPAGFRIEAFEPGEGIVATPGEVRRYETIYFDTDDLRLAGWGCSLRFRSDEGWTVKLEPSTQGSVIEREERLFAGQADALPPEAFDTVRAYVRESRLRPVVRLRTVRRPLALRRETGEDVGELVLDEVVVVERSRVTDRFLEVELELANGVQESAATPIVRRLRAAGAGPPDLTPKYARALGDRAPAGPEVSPPDIGPGSTSGDVVQAAIAASVARMLRHDPGIRIDRDSEDVHQARVATRRLRSDLQTFGALMDPAAAGELRAELRWLARLLGALRDTDVLLARFRARTEALSAQDRPAARALVRGLRRSRVRALRDLMAAMRDERYARLLERLVAEARDPSVLRTASGPAEELVGMLEARAAAIRETAGGLGEEPPDAGLHGVRIAAKRLRYAAEALAPVLGKPVPRVAKSAAGVQSVLGDHHDAVVAGGWLRERARVSPAGAFVAGEMAAAEREDELRARAAWPSAWRSLDRAMRKLPQ
jgi:CHAD domain-containing protein